MVPGPEDERAVARTQVGGLDRAQRVAAGLDEGAERVVDRVGQRVQRGRGHGELLGQRAGTATADAELAAELAHVLVAAPAAPAGAAAEHRVARDAAAEPAPGRRPSPTARTVPIHSCPMRIGSRVAVVQVLPSRR